MSTEQLLRDADAITDDGITYAALILFGKRPALLKYLPTAEVVFEYRSTEASGPAGQRMDFRDGFFNFYDAIWEIINNRNENQHYQDRFAMLPVPTFNERVVREALLNAVSHRNYQQGGSIFVRQYHRKLVIESPGGFPIGVTVENILDRHQARNGRIAAIFQLCGLVERSGQGMNLIYEQSVREAKPLPHFLGSDGYIVKLTLDCKVIHPRMLAFVKQIGANKLEQLSTDDYLLLGAIFRGEDLRDVDITAVGRLIALEIVKHTPEGIVPIIDTLSELSSDKQRKSSENIDKNEDTTHFIGTQSELSSDKVPINSSDKQNKVLEYMAKHDFVTTAELAELLQMSQRGMLKILHKLEAGGLIAKTGKNRGTKYILTGRPV